MTYAELGSARGISPKSAERLAQRRRWPRQLGNDGIARVLVPFGEDRVSPRRQGGHPAPDIGADVGERLEASVPDIGDVIRAAIREVIVPLSAQLDVATRRADRAQRLAECVDEEQLADVPAAARIARDDAAGLRAELNARKQWGLWRRLRGGDGAFG
jgi:hypothetical protein